MKSESAGHDGMVMVYLSLPGLRAGMVISAQVAHYENVQQECASENGNRVHYKKILDLILIEPTLV